MNPTTAVRWHRKLVLAIALVGLAVTTFVGTAGAAEPPQPSHGRRLVSGLQGTVGATIGPDGALYVPEAAVGKITRVDRRTGQTSTFADNLPPRVIPVLGGVIDVAFIGRTAYALVTLVSPDVGGTSVDGIYRIDGPHHATIIADIGTWSIENPPPPIFPIDTPSGLQFALQPIAGGFLVTDGHHNRVLRVTLRGRITQVIGFNNVVPTGLAVACNTVYVSEVGPVPYLPADGKVVSFPLHARRPRTARVVASGFSTMVDVEFGPHGVLYALSQGDTPDPPVHPADPAKPSTGELLRVNRDGTFSVVVDKLNRPSSLDFVGDTAYITTLNGEVWKVKGVSDLARHGRNGERKCPQTCSSSV
jgi:hypothetical protein